MFWRMTGLSTVSPLDTILDKDNYTLEELLDEDEIIQECKSLNTRLINFLRDKAQVERLLYYIVEESPEDAENQRTFKFPFVACEIFTCEVDIILRTLVEDEELMNLLFSFLKPEHPHSSLLAGYFSKVVICLTLRKATSLLSYVKDHKEIFSQLVDLIGIKSIVEVLIRLIGADENMYSSYANEMQWLEDTEVLELIVDKFSSSDNPQVHANAAEVLCAITRYAPPGLAAKICSPTFVGRLFRHTLDDARPKSVLVHSLSVCMSLLDPKRLERKSNQPSQSQQSDGSRVTANPGTVNGMLENLGQLLKLLDVLSSAPIMPTTYGTLEPPLGIRRLKIVEFISVLLETGNDAAEKELIRLGAMKPIIDMFFKYPFNSFLHNHVDSILTTCLDSKTTILSEHLLEDCEIVNKILAAEKQPTLSTDSKPTVSAERRSFPRIGNIGHITRIANKLIQLGNNNSMVQTHLQENNEWVDWHTNTLLKRNAVENLNHWTCGRPTTSHDQTRDSDDDFRDRDYDVAALASNLNQAFRYGIYSNDDIEEAHRSFERDDEDVYFDDESAEVVISSLRLGDDQDSSSIFTNSNWFAFEEGREANAGSLTSPSANSDEAGKDIVNETATSLPSSDSVPVTSADESISAQEPSEEEIGPSSLSEEEGGEKPTEWVEWRETSHSDEKPVPDVHYGQTSAGGQDNIVSDGKSSSGTPCELSDMSSTDAAIGHVEPTKKAIESDSE